MLLSTQGDQKGRGGEGTSRGTWALGTGRRPDRPPSRQMAALSG